MAPLSDPGGVASDGKVLSFSEDPIALSTVAVYHGTMIALASAAETPAASLAVVSIQTGVALFSAIFLVVWLGFACEAAFDGQKKSWRTWLGLGVSGPGLLILFTAGLWA